MANIAWSPIQRPWQPSEDFSNGTTRYQSCRHRGSRPQLAPSAGYECSSSGESTITTVEPHPTQAQGFRQPPQFVQEPPPAYERQPSPVTTRTTERAICAYRFCVCLALLALLGSILVVELVRVCSSRCGGCSCCVQGDGYESRTPSMMPPVVSTPIGVACPTTALSSPKGEQETLKGASMRLRLENERAVERASGCTLFIDSKSPLDDTEIPSPSTCRKEDCSGIYLVDRTTVERAATEMVATTADPNSTVTGEIEPSLPLDPISPNPDVDDPGGESLDVESETSCWIYMHMAKSGANLVRSIATKRWRRDERIFDSVQWHRGDSYALDTMTNSRWRLMHGGFVEALRRYQTEAQDAPGGSERGTCAWFTVFRDPVARLISAFDHCQKAPQDPLCGSADTTDLESFAEYWGNFGLRQFALASVSSTDVKKWAAHLGAPRGRSSAWYLVKKYLSRGHEKSTVDDEVLEGMLEQVKETLTTGYDAIGIAEELDATMNLFDKVLPMPGVDWATSFREHRAVRAREIDIDAVEAERVEAALANPRINVALKLDISLYEHALHIFRKQATRASLEQEP